MGSNRSIIDVCLTGGTIDKRYDPRREAMVLDGFNCISDIVRKSGLSSVRISVVAEKDSLEFTEDDVRDVIRFCELSSAQGVLVVHGTSTMVRTASAVKQAVSDKTVIFTGAMCPYSYDQAEAAFNIGFALSAIQYSPRAVYIAMHGNLFDPERCVKDQDRLLFISSEETQV